MMVSNEASTASRSLIIREWTELEFSAPELSTICVVTVVQHVAKVLHSQVDSKHEIPHLKHHKPLKSAARCVVVVVGGGWGG